MVIQLQLEALLALLAGIIILVKPKTMQYIVAIYLIIVGVVGLFPDLHF